MGLIVPMWASARAAKIKPVELLAAVAENLDRHATALERLADELERAAPGSGTRAGKHWLAEDIDGRIERMRHEAVLARRAIRRVETAVAAGEEGQAPEQAAA
jgi:hypothetical protein